jgi:Trm5-related predicted tRNA methylase
MSETYSKSRQQAEKAFSKTQTQATARKRLYDDIESAEIARQAKNTRLREARMARDLQDQSSSAEAPVPAGKTKI